MVGAAYTLERTVGAAGAAIILTIRWVRVGNTQLWHRWWVCMQDVCMDLYNALSEVLEFYFQQTIHFSKKIFQWKFYFVLDSLN